MFVMKYQFPCPAEVTEFGYLEQIDVHNGIAVVQYEATRDYLFSVGYDEIGQISRIEELHDLLLSKSNSQKSGETIKESTSLAAGVTVSPVIMSNPGNRKFWWK